MIQPLFRTLILYALLVLAMRITGKRQIGQLQLSELVTTLLISEIAVAPIMDKRIPLINAIAPILLVVGLELAISFLVTKSPFVKNIFEGKPSFLIKRGKIDDKELLRQRISLDELLASLRIAGFSSPGEISFAVMEGNGQLSVFAKEQETTFAHPIILDGRKNEDACCAAGLDDGGVTALLKKNHCRIDEVFLMTIDAQGTVFLAKKTKK